MMTLRSTIWFLVGLTLVAFCVRAFGFEGRVVSVHDGDTLTVLNENGAREKIRLVKVDAPELTQPYGRTARALLVDLCLNQTAIVTRKGKSYDRSVAAVICEGQDAGRYLVERGLAWRYRYSSDKGLDVLQAQAKRESLGLWASANPIEPIDWRKGRRQ